MFLLWFLLIINNQTIQIHAKYDTIKQCEAVRKNDANEVCIGVYSLEGNNN